MSAKSLKTWLVAYDIRDKRRLRQVHRLLRREGAAIQYSAFCLEADDQRIRNVLGEIGEIIDSCTDDVRAYHVPEWCRVWQVGRLQLPEGVQVEGSVAAKRLLSVAVVDAEED